MNSISNRPISCPVTTYTAQTGTVASEEIADVPATVEASETLPPAQFRLLFVLGPRSNGNIIDNLAQKASEVGLELYCLGDGNMSIGDALSALAIEPGLPLKVICSFHGSIEEDEDGNEYHMAETEADGSGMKSSDVMKCLHDAGAVSVTVATCHATSIADGLEAAHLGDVGGRGVDYNFMGNGKRMSEASINDEDILSVVDYLCSCVREGVPPPDMRELQFIAQASAQELTMVRAKDPAAEEIIARKLVMPEAIKETLKPDIFAARLGNSEIPGESKAAKEAFVKDALAGNELLEIHPVVHRAREQLPSRALLQQAYAGKTKLVRKLLDAKVSPTWNGTTVMSPLQLAASRGHAKTVQLLVDAAPGSLEEGAGSGLTPLGFAVNGGSLQCTEMLLDAKADPNARDAQFSVLLWATGARDPDIVETLLAHRADPNLAGSSGVLPLEQAIFGDDIDSAIELLKAGGDPEKIASHGKNALWGRMGPERQEAKTMLHDYAQEKGLVKVAELLANASGGAPDDATAVESASADIHGI